MQQTKNINLFFVLLVVLTITSCKYKSESKSESEFICTEKPIHEISYFKLDSLNTMEIIAYSRFNGFYSLNSLKTLTDSSIALLSPERDSIIVFTFNTEKKQYIQSNSYSNFSNKIINFTFINQSDLVYLGEKKKSNQLVRKDLKSDLHEILVNDTSFVITNSFNGNDFYISKDVCILSHIKISRNSVQPKSLFQKFNLKTSKITGEIGKNKTASYLYPLFDYPGILLKGDSVILFYGYKNAVELYDFNTTKKLSNVCLKSRFAPVQIKGLSPKQVSNFQISENHIIEKEYYLKLIWHPYLRKFIRIFKHRQPLKDKNQFLNERYKGPWSILIINENLEIESEIVMPAGVFNFYSYILTKQGIAFSLCDQDKIKFNEILL